MGEIIISDSVRNLLKVNGVTRDVNEVSKQTFRSDPNLLSRKSTVVKKQKRHWMRRMRDR